MFHFIEIEIRHPVHLEWLLNGRTVTNDDAKSWNMETVGIAYVFQQQHRIVHAGWALMVTD